MAIVYNFTVESHTKTMAEIKTKGFLVRQDTNLNPDLPAWSQD